MTRLRVRQPALLVEALFQRSHLRLKAVHSRPKIGHLGAKRLLLLGSRDRIKLLFDSTQSLFEPTQALIETDDRAQKVSVLRFEGLEALIDRTRRPVRPVTE
mgnify:CR=1 FL=1